MDTLTLNDKVYHVDSGGFLLNYDDWDEDFAEGMAPSVGIREGLVKEQWNVIYFIRHSFRELGKCPLVYQTCKMNGLRLKDLAELFPGGYLRGACKLAGVTYKEGYVGQAALSTFEADSDMGAIAPADEKTYEIDVRGFLVNPENWDARYAVFKAHDLKMPGGLSESHWNIIHFLRDRFVKNGTVPTVYETCGDNGIDLEELERLFPDGYHRGAVKIAGLRVR
ncbi:MAG: TusE/DsrC/DsvC family sulfur relay protein [candidate division Zixibacteria bacterium]|nr:TusE/DsrC/DsvC family sulfur relay protein [candidate division Zixibacteria bacterium]